MPRKRLQIFIPVLLILSTMTLHSQALPRDAEPVSLTNAQQKSLLGTTCDAKGAADQSQIRAWRLRGKAGFGATVWCPSLPSISSFPAFRSHNCESGSGAVWTCAQPRHAVRITVNSRQIFVVYQDGAMSPELAMDITLYFGEQHPLTFNGYNLREMMIEGECSVAPAGAGALAGTDNYLLHCGPNQLTVGRQCVGERCRLFPVTYRVQPP